MSDHILCRPIYIALNRTSKHNHGQVNIVHPFGSVSSLLLEFRKMQILTLCYLRMTRKKSNDNIQHHHCIEMVDSIDPAANPSPWEIPVVALALVVYQETPVAT